MPLSFDEIREILIKEGVISRDEQLDTMDFRALRQNYIMEKRAREKKESEGEEYQSVE